MKRCLALFFLMAFLATAAFAAGPNQYQWTGTVLELKDDVIVVEKGKEKWEIGRDKDTKVTGGDLKVGSKVTVYYTMKATSIEVKGEGKKVEPTKAEPKKRNLRSNNRSTLSNERGDSQKLGPPTRNCSDVT